MGCHVNGVESLSQLFECFFYHSVRNLWTENNCALCFAFNKLWWWILMFLATVILLLSCIEITSSSSTPAANMVKSYSLNPLWTMITTMFQEKSNTYHISEPIIRRFFPQNLCHFVHFRAVSVIHSALQWNAATLPKVLAPFSFSHVIDAYSLYISCIPFLFFPFLSWLFFL